MFFNFFLTILFTSLFIGFFIIFFGNKIGFTKIYIAYFFFFITSLIYLFSQVLFFINSNSIIRYKLFDIISFDNYLISFTFLIDKLTIVMIFVVVCISFFVSLFSVWYMKGDPCQLKFLTYLNFFMFFMLLLVSSDSLIIIFIGWEGIGLFSYLLINFWTSRISANRAAFKAIFVNKFGDVALYLFMTVFFFAFEIFTDRNSKPLYIHIQYDKYVLFKLDVVFIISVSLIIAAMAKSAQFLMHVWLPDAMEGPTPVSALLHAATMVTAGAYILIKFNWILYYNENIFYFLALIGVLTNFLSSFVAIFYYDSKKIIAYSTASQMGLIFVGIGVSKPFLAFFHLYNHAFFKALLFILAGVIIHFLNDKQDSRLAHKIKENFFFIYSAFLVSLSTLLGIPFLSSFYSKEIIIHSVFLNMHIWAFFIVLFLNFSVITTILYSFKIILFVFFSKISENKFLFILRKKKHDLFIVIIWICYCLIFFSIFSGFLLHSFFYIDSIYLNMFTNDDLFIEKGEKSLSSDYFSIFTIFVSMIFAFRICRFFFIEILKYNLFFSYFLKLTNFFSRKFFFDNFYFYICKFIFVLKNLTKEEKNFNEGSFLFLIKKKKEKTIKLISFIFFNKILLGFFVVLIMLNVLIIIFYPSMFFLWVISCFINLTVKK